MKDVFKVDESEVLFAITKAKNGGKLLIHREDGVYAYDNSGEIESAMTASPITALELDAVLNG